MVSAFAGFLEGDPRQAGLDTSSGQPCVLVSYIIFLLIILFHQTGSMKAWWSWIKTMG